MPFNSMLDAVGNTPLVRTPFKSPHSSIWIKLEGQNPSGSIKDRACLSNIRDAERTGRLRPGMTLLDASSGNMACSLAYFGRIMGYRVHVVCSSKLTRDKADFIRFFKGELEAVGEFTIEGNRYCREVILPREPDRYCFLDQLHNWANPLGSFSTLGPELIADFPEPAAIVGSLGSGGSLLGVAQYVKPKSPNTKIFAVEARAGTRIPGTGSFVDGDYVTPFIEKGWSEKLFDKSISIDLEEAQQGTKELADCGIFVGFQTGGVYRAAQRMLNENQDIRGPVIAISGDSGWKNLDKLLQLS